MVPAAAADVVLRSAQRLGGSLHASAVRGAVALSEHEAGELPGGHEEEARAGWVGSALWVHAEEVRERHLCHALVPRRLLDGVKPCAPAQPGVVQCNVGVVIEGR